jgi:DNA helicase IV
VPRHPEVDLEQAYLDHAHHRLQAMRQRTERLAAIADSAAQAVDSALAQAHLARRAASMVDSGAALAFGRLDHEHGDRWYVGRRHVEDEAGDPLVVDWRAPVAVPFYRATAVDPMELARRRRFVIDGRRVTDLFDEVFDDPDSVAAGGGGGVPDPLLAELERSRTGELRDIVATIQAEQDVVIRAPLERCLIVQGGPGTGKTAVGLHRAAFLLYEHRGRLDDEGVLVVGPNPVFLRYIAQVLPSLGEVAVRQTTVEGLVAGRVRAVDPPDVARLKGDARMADVLARAVAGTRRPPADLVGASPWGSVRVAAADVAAAVAEVAGRGVPANVGRHALRTLLLRRAHADHVARRGEAGAVEPEELAAGLRGDRAWGAALERLWPAVSGPALVRRLLGGGAALAAAADGILDADEQRLLHRRSARRLDDEPWTLADLVLVDEAEGRADGARRSYGHVVVDEAQDLTAMELRLLARRCPRRSMTVLGDLAQSTAVGGQRSWEEVLRWLGEPAGASVVELALGYRVPAPIMDLANRLLPSAAPGVAPTRSVRELGRDPVLVDAGGEDGLGAAVAAEVARLAGAWASVAVVVPDALAEPVAGGLAAAGVGAAGGAALGPDQPVVLLSPAAAKGLEFDAVVVVEPAAVAVDDRGARLLYVALTRAVQELVIVHARGLPAALVA